jgi:hypothetical protein
MPQPDPDPGGFWPSCDDEEPGVSIRPLSHADLAALLAHLDQHDHQDPGPLLGSGRRGQCWRCGCGPASAAPAPLPTPNTGAEGPLFRAGSLSLHPTGRQRHHGHRATSLTHSPGQNRSLRRFR